MRPVEHLNAISKQFPNAWKQVDMFRKSKVDDLPDWPNWCFLPFAAWYAIVSGGGSLGLYGATDIAKLAAIGTWRYTQGVYRFDDDVYKSLIDTDFDREMPIEVLYRLKEWCVYIETPDFAGAHGFYASLEHDINTKKDELRLLIDADDGLMPIILHMGDWTVEVALEKAFGVSMSNLFMAGSTHTAGELKAIQGGLIEWQARVAKHCLSLLLYLCSDEPDINPVGGELPERTKPKKTKKGWQFFPPAKPKIWNVGREIGEQIRKWKKAPTGAEHASPKAHIRRAHWHGFWTGKRGSHGQKFIYKWVAPVFVNSKGEI